MEIAVSRTKMPPPPPPPPHMYTGDHIGDVTLYTYSILIPLEYFWPQLFTW